MQEKKELSSKLKQELLNKPNLSEKNKLLEENLAQINSTITKNQTLLSQSTELQKKNFPIKQLSIMFTRSIASS